MTPPSTSPVSHVPAPSRFVRWTIRLFVLIAMLRLLSMLLCLILNLTIPVDCYHLESKMVYVAREFQRGERLYPDWQNAAHESNFFGPLYFVTTGGIAKMFELGNDGIRRACRYVTCLSLLIVGITAAIAGSKSDGSNTRILMGTALLGSLVSAMPFYGFGFMARPDLLALALGIIGFFLSCRTPIGTTVIGTVALSAAILTKQTAVSFLLATVLFNLVNRRIGRAALAGIGVSTVTLSVILTLTVTSEPRCLQDMLAEASSQFSLEGGWNVIGRLVRFCPEMYFGAGSWAVIFAFHLARRRKQASPLEMADDAVRLQSPIFALLCVTFLTGHVSCFKIGADVNYMLDFAVAGSIALVQTLVRRNTQGLHVLIATGVMIPGLIFGLTQFAVSYPLSAAYAESVSGKPSINRFVRALREEERVYELARSTDVTILSDSPYIAYSSATTPPFVDVWLFRQLALNGRIQLEDLSQAITSQEYDIVVTTSPLDSADYSKYEFGFPAQIRNQLNQHYQFIGQRGRFFVYSRN